jgi:hypothetical protein
MTPRLTTYAAGRRSGKTIVRGVFALAALVAIFSVALANPNAASAHYTDSLHRHGWTYVSGSQVTQCFNNSWDPYGSESSQVVMYWPNLVTSPVRIINGIQYNQKVHLLAELQYYDFDIRDWKRAAGEPYSSWYYTSANNNGMVGWWYEDGTNRYAPNRLSFPVVPGYYYRIKVWYHWDVDNVWHSDVTNYCWV